MEFAMLAFFRERRRRQLRGQPFPKEWRDVLEERVAYYGLLSDREREALHGHIQVLLAEKRFVGCRGLDLTPAMQVIIAGQASILMLGRDFRYFPRLGSVLVYPRDFVTRRKEHHEWGLVTEEEVVQLGESWSIGAVVLSWREVERDAARVGERNVVLHEFAHQVDQEDGASDGWPLALDADLRAAWHAIMTREYQGLVAAVEAGRRTVIDPYGATAAAEFFAVVTEAFFTTPAKLVDHHPELYALYRDFYRQDPNARVSV
jgi:MtfA peptidase